MWRHAFASMPPPTSRMLDCVWDWISVNCWNVLLSRCGGNPGGGWLWLLVVMQKDSVQLVLFLSIVIITWIPNSRESILFPLLTAIVYVRSTEFHPTVVLASRTPNLEKKIRVLCKSTSTSTSYITRVRRVLPIKYSEYKYMYENEWNLQITVRAW